MTDLHHTLSRLFGFSTFRPGQQEAITSLLAGEHTLVVMPTGAGKSLIYQYTAMYLPAPAVTLVISPLIALMKDQVDSLHRQAIPATYINSAIPAGEQFRRLQAAIQGEFRLIYVAPERLRNSSFQQALRRMTIGLLVVDEAHCISHWGHDFRPDYRRIAQARAEMGNPLTAALTATATTLVQDDIVDLLAIPAARRIVTGFNRPNLSFEVCYASDTSSKLEHLARLLRAGVPHHDNHTPADHLANLDGTAIIYTGTRRDAAEVAGFIADEIGIPAGYYHAGLDNAQRAATQEAFLQGDLPVVVATNAFGMGIDRPDVRLVVHFSLPGTLEAYYQEAGRAGRDGHPSRAVLLYAPQDRILQQWFIENSAATFQDLQALYRALARSGQPDVATTLEDLAYVTRLDAVKVRVGMAHLERAGILRQTGDDGVQMQVFLEQWDATAVTTVTATLESYRDHRQRQLDQMTNYAEADACRRRIVLRYFSDHGPADADRCCDNCAAQQAPPPEPQDVATLSRAERAALVILDTVKRLDWGVGRRRLADILKGSRAKGMTSIYTQQTYYGRFAEFSRARIEEMIEQLVVQGYLKVVGGDMPVLALSHQGHTALAARAAIALNLPGAGQSADDRAVSARGKRKRYADSGTVAETEALFRQGLSPEEIAERRGLTERTIFQHLASLVGAGRLALSDVVADAVTAQVQAMIDQVGDLSRLSPLKERLPDSISYAELRCVVEDAKRRQPAPVAADDAPQDAD